MSVEGLKKSAVLILALGEEKAADVLKNLTSDELQRISRAISELKGVNDAYLRKVLRDFSVDVKSQSALGVNNDEFLKDILEKTDFKKIMENAKAFIDAGGHATWQFIPYKHNEHQTKDCFKLSQQMKFKKFKIAKLYRKQTVARHYKTGIEFELLPADSLKSLTNIGRLHTTVEFNNCMHLSIPSVYMSADGKLSRCCYLCKEERFEDVTTLLSTVTDFNNHLCIKNCG